MKKLGFTLSELLVSLSIIGVVAVITAPIISNLMPDKNKVQVLKVYKILTDMTSDFLNDSSIYYPGNEDDGYNGCEGLDCMQMPLIAPYKNPKFLGVNKYANLLMSNLDTTDANPSISGFTTQDGCYWTIQTALSPLANPLTGANMSYIYRITIDLDSPNKGKNCLYSTSCQKPDRHAFMVDENGKITGSDALTKAYLKNPFKLNDKKNDYKTASKL